VSSFYDWQELPSVVQQSIVLNSDPDRGPTCGCHKRGDRWWLCQYHVGMVDGAEGSTEHFTVALNWCLAGWMTVGVGIGYIDLVNLYKSLTGNEPPKWSHDEVKAFDREWME
jgi:hypothetical protein